MKILVISQYFWPEVFRINDLTKELVNKGHEVTVFTGLPNYPYGKYFSGYGFFKGPFYEEKDGVKIIRIPQPARGEKKGIRLIINYLFYGFIGSLIAPFRLKNEFDCIFIYGLSPIFLAIPGIILKKMWKIPTYFWVTDLWPESLEAAGITKNKYIIYPVRKLTNWIYRNCDKILTTSLGFIDEIKKQGVSKDKMIFWPQWAEPIFEEKTSSQEYSDDRFPSNRFTILFAGNVGTSQDMPTILKAAEILKDNKNIVIVILGDGLALNDAKILANTKKLNNIIFLGRKPLETMPYYFSKSDVLLVSLVDTFLFSITIPSKIQSYLASRKPILASLNGEGAEIIKKWDAGIAVPASSPVELSDAILKLSSLGEKQLSTMGENAYECYKSLFDREVLFDKFEKILKSNSLD